jgi:hypothetical protein
MPEKLPARHYSDREKIDQALLALVVTGGNASAAHTQLEAAGINVPRRTLQDWRTRHAQRYQQLQDQYGPQLEQQIVRNTRERISALDALEGDVIQKLHEDLDSLEAKDKANALKSITTSKAINVDKLLTLTNRPSVIVSNQSADDLEAEIASIKRELLQEFGIDPTTITDADVVDG